MGFLILAISGVLLVLSVLQMRAGVVFRPLTPLYREAEPFEFWCAVVGGFAASALIAAFGVAILAGRISL